MKRFPIFLALLLFISLAGFSQVSNLVPNGDFETLSGFPTGQGQLYRASGWSNCNGFTSWPYASPDLFHTSASGNVQLPNTVAGSVNAYQGNSISGLITHNGFVSNFREYISCQLTSPMEVGQAYTVEFYITNGFANWYGKRGSTGLGAAFTLTQPAQVTNEVLAIVPQIEITSIVHHVDWSKYSFVFTPTQPFQYLTIGNFRSDVATSVADFTTGQNFAYYFIDVISVTKVGLLAAEELQLQQVEDDNAMKLEWHLPADAAGDVLALERSMDQQSFDLVHDFGKVENPDGDVHYIDEQALPGITYYYRLRDLTANGVLRYSSLLTAKFGSADQFVAGEVYPNPFADRFSLRFAALEDGELTVDLIDGSGRVVLHEVRDIQIGYDDPEFILPQDLPAGIYQANFKFGTKAFTKKLMVSASL